MLQFFDKLNELLASARPFVLVTVVDTIGSVPQDVGSKMLVTKDGLFYGTVGGGKIEARAISEARSMLLPPSGQSDGTISGNGNVSDNGNGIVEGSGNGRVLPHGNTRFWNWSLHKDIGMTCGGSVKMFMEAFQSNPWRITVFGAGHISNALMRLLINLDCRITCYDTRPEWLAKLPDSPRLVKVCSPNLVGEIASVPEGDFFLLMTMGHSSDMPVLLEILKSRAPHATPYIGVIGSDAKAARLRKDVIDAGLSTADTTRFACPMGLPFGTNDPNEIAVSISAQLLQIRDNLRSRGNPNSSADLRMEPGTASTAASTAASTTASIAESSTKSIAEPENLVATEKGLASGVGPATCSEGSEQLRND